ncbi:MAG: DUF4153 domain-containing protein [Ignavibacteriales bacterium]|nr:DUF4153 domain-containing protein [Ignavibacteriales bacterium]
MKLPSIQQVVNNSTRTFRRFPLVLINAGVGTIVALILVDHEGPAQATILFNILFGAILGIPLLITIALTAEKRKWKSSMSVVAQIIGLLALTAYAWSVPSDLADAPNIHLIRLLMMAIGLHLFVAVVPYLGTGEAIGFWNYNKTLLLRSITAIIFAMALNAGLAVALAALDHLFGIDIPGKRYAELWILINGIFTTWFFLGGIPEQLDDLENSSEYPKEIKIFAQYILLPLVIVYLIILYTYMGKILIAWNWPQGWVSRLILGFSTVGMLMHLLFYPIRDHVENVWVKSALRWFYIVMVPLVIMLLFAVSRRVSEYGMTEGRYIGVATGVWLALIVLYFIFSRGKSIKVIPGSLGILSMLICFGSWGAFDVSESSQVARLKELLTNSSILVDGTVRPADKSVPFEQTKEICSIIDYLHDIHGYDRIQPWFKESLRDDSTSKRSARKAPSLVTKMMGIEYVKIWEGTATNEINLRMDTEQAIKVEGYHRLWRGQVFTSSPKIKEIPGGGFGYGVNEGLDTLTLLSMKDGKPVDSIQVDMKQFTEKLLIDYKNSNTANVPPDKMSIVLMNDRMKVKLYLQHINARRQDGVLKFTTYGIVILFSQPTDNSVQ